MKAICITIVYLVLTSSFMFAQDTEMLKPKGSIYLHTGKVIKDVRIWTIDSVKIEYVKNGNLCDVKTDEVSKILNVDGMVYDFNTESFQLVTEHKDTLIVNSIVGSIIDKTEKEKYHILQYYADSTFVNAVILINKDSILTIHVLFENNIIEERTLRIEEYKEISKNIVKWNSIYMKSQKKVENPQSIKLRKVPFAFKQNFISINTFDLLLSMLSVNYEYICKSGKLGIKVPLSFGLEQTTRKNGSLGVFSGNLGYYNKSKTFSTGVEIQFFPAGQSKASYFMGPSFEFGQYNYYKPTEHIVTTTTNDYNYPYTYNSIYNTWEKKSGTYYALLFQNGFLFQPNKHFNMSVYIGMGLSVYDNSLSYDGTPFVFLCGRTGFNIGYKF